ncbi:tyrosinase-like [Scyliorhinus torazame]|uniref:tyrosinase-like n=1 Tax=Scyliorhinus torazame TaxID=75743 RepID=UPI003B59E4D5
MAGMLWPLLLPLVLASGAGAQIPRLCATTSALRSKTCCPVWEGDGSVCGEDSGRGTCQEPAGEGQPQLSERDFRKGWPTSLYSQICMCQGRFAGFDCGECKEGYRGARCESWKLSVRPGLHEMDWEAKQRFLDYLERAKTTVSERYVILVTRNTSDVNSYYFHNATVYDICTWVHYVAAKPIKTRDEPNFAHMGPGFVVWHRKYLLFFEKEMRHLTQDEDFVVPYWDWTRFNSCDICTDELMGSNDHSGKLLGTTPLTTWKEICSYDDGDEDNFHLICPEPIGEKTFITRKPGGDHRAQSLPTHIDVMRTLRIVDFDAFPFNQYAPYSFRNTIEGFKDSEYPGKQMVGLHNLVHIYLNGSISQVPSASNDPIFMLHHAFIDKIIENYLRADSTHLRSYPTHQRVPLGHRDTDYMVPFLPLNRNIDYFNYTVKFGYTYSNAPYTEEDKQFKIDSP